MQYYELLYNSILKVERRRMEIMDEITGVSALMTAVLRDDGGST